MLNNDYYVRVVFGRRGLDVFSFSKLTTIISMFQNSYNENAQRSVIVRVIQRTTYVYQANSSGNTALLLEEPGC